MKKLLALLLCFCMIFVFAACGDTKGGESSEPSSKPVLDAGNDELGDESEDESLVLDGVDQYVVCIKKGNDEIKNKIKSIKDIKGLNVGAAFGNDGEKIARHYGANYIGAGGENDIFAELIGGTKIDCVIVRKGAAEDYQNNRGTAEIILDPIVIE